MACKCAINDDLSWAKWKSTRGDERAIKSASAQQKWQLLISNYVRWHTEHER